MPGSKPKEYWISKGSSKFCDNTITDENLKVCKHNPDGFYDLISPMDSIEGGIHVIEMSAFEEAREEVACKHVHIRNLQNTMVHRMNDIENLTKELEITKAFLDTALFELQGGHDPHLADELIDNYKKAIGDRGKESECQQKESPTSSEEESKQPK